MIPSGIVTLLTDFGGRDGYVGAMKGVILSRFAQARIVDVAHGVAPQDVVAGAYALASAAPYFPPGTVHVAVVDPGVGTRRLAMVAVLDGQIFVGPDNGLVELWRKRASEFSAWQIATSGGAWSVDPQAPPVTLSPTFHGRDLFAPVAAELAAGRRSPSSWGPPLLHPAPLALPASLHTGGEAAGAVMCFDTFGNAITTVAASAVHPNARCVEVRGRRADLVRTYGDAPPGAVVALIGSAGLLEVAVVNGSAERLLGLAVGDEVQVEPPG
jgi:hypothetical protein